MRIGIDRWCLLGLSAAAALSACSGGGGSAPNTGPSSPTVVGAAPTPAAAPSAARTPTPAPVKTPTPAPVGTPTPAPAGTPTPVSTPVSVVAGADCSVPYSAIPGTYVSFASTGNTVGSTYEQDDSGTNLSVVNAYSVTLYATPPPNAPPPSPIASAPIGFPVPSAPPQPLPSPSIVASSPPVPTPSPNYYQLTSYVGSYTVPSFSGTNNFFSAPAGTFTTNVTNGCFVINLYQFPDGRIGQSVRRTAAAAGVDNTLALLDGPIFQPLPLYVPTTLAVGGFQLSIVNLTRTTGNGSFTLDNGVTGTLTVTGSVTTILTGTPPVGVTLQSLRRWPASFANSAAVLDRALDVRASGRH